LAQGPRVARTSTHSGRALLFAIVEVAAIAMACSGTYSKGVLIHNHNEDRFGEDLLKLPRSVDAPVVSVSHAVHGWKEPDRDRPPETAATQHVERHLFFGHSGDMRDPTKSLKKTDFLTNTAYFMRDPATVAAGTGKITADGFSTADPDATVAPKQSYLADRQRAGWGKGNTHAPTASDRFTTTNAADLQGGLLEKLGPSEARFSRKRADITSHVDKVQVGRGRSNALQSASAVALKSK